MGVKAARAEGFEVVVAPYEADAQLAYMAREGAIDIVITEVLMHKYCFLLNMVIAETGLGPACIRCTIGNDL